MPFELLTNGFCREIFVDDITPVDVLHLVLNFYAKPMQMNIEHKKQSHRILICPIWGSWNVVYGQICDELNLAPSERKGCTLRWRGKDASKWTEIGKKQWSDFSWNEQDTFRWSIDNRVHSRNLLQQDLFVMTVTTVFRQLEEERVWIINQSVRDHFNAMVLYEEALDEDIPMRGWNRWIHVQLVN